MSNTQPPARKIEIFYWRSAKKTHWYNYCVPEIIKAIEDYEIDRICRLKPLDFKFLNINRSDEHNYDVMRYGSLINYYRPKKLRRYPLVVIDDGKEMISVDDSGDLKRLTDLLSDIKDHYLQ